jgi:hypothetical protein
MAAAIMVLIEQVRTASQRGIVKAPAHPDDKPATLEIGDRRIDLPANKSTRREFIRLVEDDLRAHPQAGKDRKYSQR